MTKQAHITSGPGAQLGDRVLGLCGKDFKFKTKWDDIPLDKPICRECVDIAVGALDEADKMIEDARMTSMLLNVHLGRLNDALEPEDATILDEIVARNRQHQKMQEAAAELKAEEERVTKTCTCTWTTPEIFTEDPDCPIHGGHSDAIPVEIEES